jgi:hypothetical protein
MSKEKDEGKLPLAAGFSKTTSERSMAAAHQLFLGAADRHHHPTFPPIPDDCLTLSLCTLCRLLLPRALIYTFLYIPFMIHD